MGNDNTKDKKNCDPSGLGLFGQFFGVQSQLAKSTEEELSLGVTCTSALCLGKVQPKSKMHVTAGQPRLSR